MIYFIIGLVIAFCVGLVIGYLIGLRKGARRYLDGVVKNVFLDTMIFGNGFMGFNRNKKGGVGVEHIPAATVRLTPPEKKLSKRKRSG